MSRHYILLRLTARHRAGNEDGMSVQQLHVNKITALAWTAPGGRLPRAGTGQVTTINAVTMRSRSAVGMQPGTANAPDSAGGAKLLGPPSKGSAPTAREVAVLQLHVAYCCPTATPLRRRRALSACLGSVLVMS